MLASVLGPCQSTEAPWSRTRRTAPSRRGQVLGKEMCLSARQRLVLPVPDQEPHRHSGRKKRSESPAGRDVLAVERRLPSPGAAAAPEQPRFNHLGEHGLVEPRLAQEGVHADDARGCRLPGRALADCLQTECGRGLRAVEDATYETQGQTLRLESADVLDPGYGGGGVQSAGARRLSPLRQQALTDVEVDRRGGDARASRHLANGDRLLLTQHNPGTAGHIVK